MDEFHEKGDGLLSWCKPDWEVIRAAPTAFIISALAIGILEFGGLYWMFHTSIEMKNDHIENLERKITTFPTDPVGGVNAASVSITCAPVMLPIQVKSRDSIYSVWLHPKWGDVIMKAIIGDDTALWPDEHWSGAAYKCTITNSGKIDIIGLHLPFHIDYRAPEASPTDRTATVTLPDIIETRGSFVFFIFNDTIRSPMVTLPEHVYGRVHGDVKSKDILLEYSTRDGSPTKISGFGTR